MKEIQTINGKEYLPHQFKPGQVTNPKGRPPEVRHVRELARQHTVEAVETLAEIMTNKKEKASARVAAANALLDRGYGRAPVTFEDTPEQAVDLREAARRLAFIMNGAILRGDVVDVQAVDITAEADKLAAGVAERRERKQARIVGMAGDSDIPEA